MTTDALQTTLAAEHAAVWVYGVLGGQTSSSDEPELYADVLAAYRLHRGRRDLLTGLIAKGGAEPVAAEVGYELGPVGSPALVEAAALAVEQRCAATYADLVGRTTGRRRAWAIRALTDAAVRQLRFRGSPETFPGAGELANR
jgi:hypothetical protein